MHANTHTHSRKLKHINNYSTGVFSTPFTFAHLMLRAPPFGRLGFFRNRSRPHPPNGNTRARFANCHVPMRGRFASVLLVFGA